MEDMFELIVAAIVIISAVVSSNKKKQKQQPRPGKGKPAKTQQAKPKKPVAPVEEKLGDIEQKIDQWMKEMEARAKSGSGAAAASRPDMEPQRLEPEPMIPEAMAKAPMQEADMGEGESYTDEAGCVGGSMVHEAGEHHQGMDFHPRGTHGRPSRQEENIAVERVKPAVSAADLRKAVVWAEILDKPVSMRE